MKFKLTLILIITLVFVFTYFIPAEAALTIGRPTPVGGDLRVQILLVGGGGGGGRDNWSSARAAGGGGAGGYLYNSSYSVTAQKYTITIGAGGAGGLSAADITSDGSNGGNTVFASSTSLTAIGGGGGGGHDSAGSNYVGVAGGSGGGNPNNTNPAGTGTAGQGNDGGVGYNSLPYNGGGGGGAGAVGAAGVSNASGNGGTGTASSISGTSVTYAGGGGGTGSSATKGTGGSGGGGNGGGTNNGTDGLGGGGGANRGAPGRGGNGIAIIRFTTGSIPYRQIGGKVSTVGGDTVITYTSSGTFTVSGTVTTNSLSVNNKNTSSLAGWWTFDAKDTGTTYTVDKSGSGFTATTTLVTKSPGKVGQALGFNLASPPTWNQGLVGWWNMDTNRIMGTAMTDLSPSGYTGTLSGATLPSSTGSNKYGQALSFDGSTSYVDMGNVLNNDSDLTLAVWVNTSSIGHTSLDTIVAKSGAGSDFDLLIDTATGNIFGFYISTVTPTADYNVKSTTAASLNNWQHLVGVWDKTADTLKIYVNGILENTTSSVTGDRATNANNFCIGKSCNNANRLFAGKVDDVRVYNRALSATEISELYRGSSYANISPTTNLNTFTLSSTQGISLGTWVKFASSTGNQILMRKSDTATSSNSYELKSNGTNFQLQIGTTTPLTITGTTAVKPNQWYYVAGTADSSTMRLYVNGTQEASATVTGTVITSVSPTVNNWGNSLFFGMDDSPANFLVGWLDDPKIYSRALSANEVKQMYNEGNRAITTAVPKKTQSNLLTNLVAWWTFDGKDCGLTYCIDKSVSAITGTLTGTSPASGRISQARRFNGTSDYINFGNPAALQIAGNATVSFWANPASSQVSSATIFRKDIAANGGFLIEQDSATNNYKFYWLNSTNYNSIAFSLSANKWSHVTATLNGAVGKIYVNGVEVAQTTGGGSMTANTADNFTLGYWKDATTRYWQGNIDDFRIYTRTLSASEVYQLYRLGM